MQNRNKGKAAKRPASKQKPHAKGFNKSKPARLRKSKILHHDNEIQQLKESYDTIEPANIKKFTDFPLSKKTLKALNDAKYITPTEVQRLSIGYALQGRDVLGAAVTGSGKTLAFLVPVIEHLFINKWSRTDGIGAIIISPTRELAYQIFETLKKIGKDHDFSAGLIIGGKNLKFERSRMDQCNILICTPGRLLQHMDENPLFNATTMEMLVLDEADRCLDMGFEQTLNSIIENFPPDRQTLLFSATQTNTVQQLARLNLRNPAYVGYQGKDTGTKEGAQLAVPELLQQSYVVMPLEEKMTMLWSFIKNHPKQKIIVFLSSCKQVKYTYEIFCKLRPGIGLLALYGTLHQDRRIAIYEDFVRNSHVVLFATDVASRGLDFPAVNWVVQLDCPEDVSQYIHRAGRSARNKTRGESLLVLLPSEEEHMIEALEAQKINIRRIQIDPKKLFSPRIKMEAFLAQFPDLKASAQRAFLAYIKSVILQRNKRVFNVLSLDLDAYAQSLGLAVTPRVKFLERLLWKLKQKQATAQQQTKSEQSNSDDDVSDEEDNDDEEEEEDSDSKTTKPKQQNGFKALSSDTESDDEFITLKRRDHDVAGGEDVAIEDDAEPLVVPKREKLVTKTKLAKKAMRKHLQMNSKVNFDDEGLEVIDTRKQMQALANLDDNETEQISGGIDIVRSKKLMTEEDKYDKQRFRELVKKRHKLAREKLKQKKLADDDAESEDDEETAETYNNQSDDDDDGSVDLSWLPDPDKIYNTKDTANAAGHKDDDNAVSDDDDVEEPLKKKSKITDKLTLDDTEAIAANLLGFH